MTEPKPDKNRDLVLKAFKLDLNEHSDGTPDWARRAMESLPEDLVWRYTDRLPLERKLAAHFSLEPGQVLVTNGGDEAILYLLAAQQRNTTLIVPTPTFGFYEEQAAHWPLRTVVLPPLAGYRLDLEATRRAVSESGGGGLAVLVRPNNPTGEMVPSEAVEDLARLCDRYRTTLLLDEAYAEFADHHLVALLANQPNLVILRTFSKAHGLAGLRIGYLLGSSEILDPLRRRALPYNVASFSLFLAERALEPEALAETEDYCRRVRHRRDRLARWLESAGIPVRAGGGNFLLLEPGRVRAAFLAEVLRNAGILVRTFERSDLERCLRISIPAMDTPLEQTLALALAPQLLCLDVDGCLIDVGESFDAAVAGTVAAFTGQTVDKDEILGLRATSGFNDDNRLAHALILKRKKSPSLDEVIEVFERLYFGHEETQGFYLKEKPLIDVGFWGFLRQHHQIALVTGRNHRELRHTLEALEAGPDILPVTVDDVANGKPDPEGIQFAAKKFGAERIWMAGDNVDDMLAARAAGALAIGIGSHNRAALLDAGAAVVLDHIDELAELLPGKPGPDPVPEKE